MYLNGLILISAFLDGGSAEFVPGNDEPYVLYLPTYAAIAHYHGRHPGRPLREVLDDAEAYAGREYRWVLARGSRLTPGERSAAVTRIAGLTGLSEELHHASWYWEAARFLCFAEPGWDSRISR